MSKAPFNVNLNGVFVYLYSNIKPMNNAVIEVIKKLFEGADERDWQKVESTMGEQVLLDYTSMAGGSPAVLAPSQITGAWAAFLPGFDRTHHQLFDFVVNEQSNVASVQYKGKADHFINGEVWVVEGSYETELKRVAKGWVVTKHKFNFASQHGNTELPAKAGARMKGK